MKNFKKCFTCDRNYPLFMFPTNHVEYQRPENKGKCFNCKICQYKAEIKNKSYIRRIDGKFYRFEIKSKIKHLITILKS